MLSGRWAEKIAKAGGKADAPRQAEREKAHGTRHGHQQPLSCGRTKVFDRVARKWNVDYAFYKTGPDKYLLFFKSGQADAMTACFSEYSRKVLDKSKSRAHPHPGTAQAGVGAACKEKPRRKKERAKEVAHEDR